MYKDSLHNKIDIIIHHTGRNGAHHLYGSNNYIHCRFLFIIGAIDKILGNRFGYGERFTAGLMTMGSLALAMIGIISLAPVIAAVLLPVITPVYGLIGADPATFANTILAIDMGGHALAETMALTPEAGLFAWVLLGTTIGPTIVFSIPVALGIIKKRIKITLLKESSSG